MIFMVFPRVEAGRNESVSTISDLHPQLGSSLHFSTLPQGGLSTLLQFQPLVYLILGLGVFSPHGRENGYVETFSLLSYRTCLFDSWYFNFVQYFAYVKIGKYTLGFRRFNFREFLILSLFSLAEKAPAHRQWAWLYTTGRLMILLMVFLT